MHIPVTRVLLSRPLDQIVISRPGSWPITLLVAGESSGFAPFPDDSSATCLARQRQSGMFEALSLVVASAGPGLVQASPVRPVMDVCFGVGRVGQGRP